MSSTWIIAHLDINHQTKQGCGQRLILNKVRLALVVPFRIDHLYTNAGKELDRLAIAFVRTLARLVKRVKGSSSLQSPSVIYSSRDTNYALASAFDNCI